MPYDRSQEIQWALLSAMDLPTRNQIGTLVTMPNTNTVKRVTSMNGKASAQAVGAATR